MNLITRDMWIEKIYIIAHKTEEGRFDFYTSGRQWDGFVYFLQGEGYYIGKDGVKTNVDGGLIGGASLKTDKFTAIVKAAN